MKASLLALALFPLATLAHAETLCGRVDSHIERPVCRRGKMCPHWEKIVYDLYVGGHRLTLNPAVPGVASQIGLAIGRQACVTGLRARDGGVEVSSVRITD